ncbi:MAG TPA: hypothetical protein VGG82_07570 [Casimicrobiaceae bacterium]|jgi:hypothetical protein
MTDAYDFDGNPISLDAWSRLFADYAERMVALDRLGDVEVSTVWIGLDHRFGEPGAPLIYETMIFGGEHDGDQWRWPNRHAALAGHDQAVAIVRDEVSAGQRADGRMGTD